MSMTVKIRGKGALTLPVELRRKYNLEEGDVFTLIDLGDGAFVLTPRLSQVDRLGNRVAQALEAGSVPLEEMLEALDEERERYYQERYAR